MSEYIKKEDALKALHDFWGECIGYDGSGTEMMLDNESVINSLPTYSFPDSADDNTMEWISARVGKLFPSNDYKCSKCGNILNFGGVNCGRGDANFCPNCGRKAVNK